MKNVVVSTDTILTTQRLVLRYPKLDGAAGIFSVVRSPQFPEELPLKEMNTVSEIEEWLKRLQENSAAGQVFSWVVEARGSGILVGQVTLARIEGNQVWALAF